MVDDLGVSAAAAKSLQSCPTLCDPIDGSPPDSPVPGILQAITLKWVAISFSNAWKWKVKVKSLSRVLLFATPWTVPTRLLHPWDFPGKSTGVGCHCLLRDVFYTFKQIKKTMNIITEMQSIKLYHALGGGSYMSLHMWKIPQNDENMKRWTHEENGAVS